MSVSSSSASSTSSYLVSTQEINANPGTQIVVYKRFESDYKEVEQLTLRGEIREAWELYAKLCKWEDAGAKSDSGQIAPHNWRRLPPEGLISAAVDDLELPEYFQSRARCKGLNIEHTLVPMELIRDCARVYPTFAKKCLNVGAIWNRFNPCPEYIADIGQENPLFAYKVLNTSKGTIISNDFLRFDLFRSATPVILKQIKEGLISNSEIKCLIAHLFSSHSLISQKDFDLLKQVAKATKDNLPEHEEHMSSLVRKLSLQRAYKEGVGYVVECSREMDEDELIGTVRDLNLGRDPHRGFTYLSVIPTNSSNYTKSRMMLGHTWLEQENPLEAGKCFLEAAQLDKLNDFKESREDALVLVASALLVKVFNEGTNTWKYTARNKQGIDNNSSSLNANNQYVEQKSNDKRASLLTPDEVRRFAENMPRLCSILRKEYTDNLEITDLIKSIPEPHDAIPQVQVEGDTGGLD